MINSSHFYRFLLWHLTLHLFVYDIVDLRKLFTIAVQIQYFIYVFLMDHQKSVFQDTSLFMNQY